MSLQVKNIKQNIKYLGKYLDQTALTDKIYNTMPAILTGSALVYGVNDIHNTTKEKRPQKTLQNLSVLGFTVASALIATRGLKINKKQIFEGIIELPENDQAGIKEILKKPLSKTSKELVKKVNNG